VATAGAIHHVAAQYVAVGLAPGSSRAVSATARDSCDGGEEEEDGKSASYSWEMQQTRTKAASSS
jgi:hypothetical protein